MDYCLENVVFNTHIDLQCGDCLELMREIPDNSIDMVLCDLPYGTTDCKWDNVIPFEPLWQQYKRVTKENSAIVLFGSEPFSTELRHSNLKMYKYDWIWNKRSAGNIFVAKYQPLKIHETISVFSNGRHNYYPIYERGHEDRTNEKPTDKKSDLFSNIKSGQFKVSKTNKPADARYPKSIIEISKQATECANGKALHPTQKPVELLEYLIKTYTLEGDVVLDNCMGSGSTGVACVNTNRKFIGMELDEKYFNIAKQRIDEALNNKE